MKKNVVVHLIAIAISLSTLSVAAQGQSCNPPLQTGQVTVTRQTYTCPSNSGWHVQNCVDAKVTSCCGANDLNFTYGYQLPQPGVGPNGIIVLLTGGGGTGNAGTDGTFTTIFFEEPFRLSPVFPKVNRPGPQRA